MAKQKPLQAGDLDRKIDILRSDRHLNSMGEEVAASFGPYLRDIWAHYEPGTGEETEESDRDTSFNTDTFTVRYRTDLDAKMILVFEGVQYDILSISPGKERRQWTIIKARKRD